VESPRLEGVPADLEVSGYKHSWGSGGMLSHTPGSCGELCSLLHCRSTPYAAGNQEFIANTVGAVFTTILWRLPLVFHRSYSA
jgi:hypothetical protein